MHVQLKNEKDLKRQNRERNDERLGENLPTLSIKITSKTHINKKNKTQ